MKDVMIVVALCIAAIILTVFVMVTSIEGKMKDASAKEITVSEQQQYEELENRLRKLELDLYMQGQTLKRISEKLERGND